MAAKPQFELVKVVAQAVVAHREGDRIVNEEVGAQMAFYTPEALAEFYEACLAEVAGRNATANRATRRGK
jgi:hypothetical protein